MSLSNIREFVALKYFTYQVPPFLLDVGAGVKCRKSISRGRNSIDTLAGHPANIDTPVAAGLFVVKIRPIYGGVLQCLDEKFVRARRTTSNGWPHEQLIQGYK